MHRFSSRSDESDELIRRMTRKRVPRRPPQTYSLQYVEEADGGGTRFAGRAVRVDDFVGAVENLCIVRARG